MSPPPSLEELRIKRMIEAAVTNAVQPLQDEIDRLRKFDRRVEEDREQMLNRASAKSQQIRGLKEDVEREREERTRMSADFDHKIQRATNEMIYAVARQIAENQVNLRSDVEGLNGRLTQLENVPRGVQGAEQAAVAAGTAAVATKATATAIESKADQLITSTTAQNIELATIKTRMYTTVLVALGTCLITTLGSIYVAMATNDKIEKKLPATAPAAAGATNPF